MSYLQTSIAKVTRQELSYRTYIIWSFLAFLVTWIIIWIYIILFPMAYAGRYYPLSLAKTQLASECKAGEVVVFGDSRAVAGVLPTVMELPTENLAFPAASPVETYFLVKRILRCPNNPHLVVIAHSASMFPKDEYFWSVFASLGVLSTAEIRKVEADAKALGDDELMHAERSHSVPLEFLPTLYAIHFPPLYFADLLDGYVAARWRYNERAMRDALDTSGRSSFGTAPGSDAISGEADMTDWRVSPLVNLYLNRTLSLLASRDIPVMIITMPVNATTCKHLPAVVQSRFSKYLAEIAKAHSNVAFVDATIPCWPDIYYGDAWHFNMLGAVAYSHDLQHVLSNLLQSINSDGMFKNNKMIMAQIDAPLTAHGRPEMPDE